MHTRRLLITAAFLSLIPEILSAQTTLANRFNEDRFRQSLRLDGSRPMYASDKQADRGFEYGGDWTFSLGSDAIFDSNAYRNSFSKDDWRWEYGAALKYDWWTNAESGIVLTPKLTAGGQRYDQFTDQDGDSLGVGVTFAFNKVPLKPELTYSRGWGFESGFGTHVYTEDVIGLAFGGYLIGSAEGSGSSLTWQANGGYQFTDPSASEAASVGLALEYSLPLIAEKLDLVLDAGIAYRDYAHKAPTARDTWLTTASAQLEWHLTKEIALVTGVSYTHADDRINSNDYDQVLASVSLKYVLKGFRLLGLPKGHAEESSSPAARVSSK